MAEPCPVLFVCTANICRSPAAEYLARHEYGENDFWFRSAGFLYDDHPITEKMTETLDSVGVTGSSKHVSHIVDMETLNAAEFIFTMESRHLRDLTIMDRALFAKTVPLTEAAEMLDKPLSREQFSALLAARQPSAYFDERWDVPDPYKRSGRHYRQAVDTISGLVTTVFGNLS